MRIIVVSIYDGGYGASVCYHNTSSGDKELYILDDFDISDKSKLNKMPPVMFDLACSARRGCSSEVEEILSSRGRTLFDLAVICEDGGIELLKGE